MGVLAAECGEFAEQLDLPVGELDGHVDVDDDDVVAPSSPPQSPHPFAGESGGPSRLGPRRDRELLDGTVEDGRPRRGAERCLRHPHPHPGDDIVPGSLESGIVSDDDLDVQIARTGVAGTRLALTVQAETGSRHDAGGNLHANRRGRRNGHRHPPHTSQRSGMISPVPSHASHAATDMTVPMRPRRAVRTAPAPLHVGHVRRTRPRLGPRAGTDLAPDVRPERDVGGHAERRFGERDGDPGEDVPTPLGPPPSRSAEEATLPEYGAEEVVDAAEAAEEIADVDGVAPVVAAATLRVGEDLVGLGDLAESGLGRGVPGIGVGMGLPGERPESLLDLLGTGIAGDAREWRNSLWPRARS